jgi:hypothetical protein
MAVNTKPPWWLSGTYVAGLILVFIGQRAFGHISLALPVTLIGVAAVFAAAGWRTLGALQLDGDLRKIEIITLACYAAGCLALILYFLTTDTGMSLVGIEDENQARWKTPLTVLWAILVGCSLLPLTMIESTRGWGRGVVAASDREADGVVDSFRVREMAASGLTIALATALLMVTCNIASVKNVRKEVRRFKTTNPGTAVENIVKNGITDELRVIMFFPENNEVAAEALAYFRELDQRTGGKLDIERVDRLVKPKLAEEHKVSTDGTVVLIKGDKSENIRLSDDIERARRSDLPELDGEVEKALLKLMRAKKTAYLMVGHGELNDPDSAGPLGFNPGLKAGHIRRLLGALNYEIKNFDGLGKPVPDDADILMVLGPMKPLLPEELESIDDYLARGGSLLIGLDPTREARLGLLEGRLGVTLNEAPLTDDKEFMMRRRNVSDHRLILTNQFSSHASVSSLSRGSARAGILLVNAGSLDDAEFTTKGSKPKRTYVVRSMATSFRDLNNNFAFDKGEEKRTRYNVVAAIEDPNARPEKVEEGSKPKGMRAVVIADAELFTDALLLQVPKVMALMADSIKWLGGEEQFQGTVESEKDVKIEQTKHEDAVWFWSSIVGVPALVLGVGLLMIVFRRRRRARGRS